MRAVGRRAIVVVLLGVLVAAVAWMVWGPDVSDGVVGKANVVGGLAGIAALVGAIWAVWPKKADLGPESTPVTEDQFRAAVAYLARETLSYWRQQAKARRITTPAPARLSWRWADREAAPPVAEVVGNRSPLLLLTDRVVSELRCDLYEVLPEPSRIVILGGPGAGKTTAMLLLLIDVLAGRAKAVKAGANEAQALPVPVWLTLGGWNPDDVGLMEYAAVVLNRDYPGLAAYAGPGTALELLGSGRIALFMDGLDEMPDGVRGPALEAIDRVAAEVRVVVTSRPEEYRSASELHRLWGAAVIDLQQVDLEHACEFLLFQQAGARRAAWEKVIDHMRGHPDGVAARTLRDPLALGLARDNYTHTNAGPQALLDFSTSDALLKHLLVRSLEVAYPVSEERAQAVRWLSWIAGKLDGHRDIRWWDIADWLANDRPFVRKMRGVAAGSVPGLAIGIMVGVGVGLVQGSVQGFGFGSFGLVAFGLLSWHLFQMDLNPRILIFRKLDRKRLGRMVIRGIAIGGPVGLVVGFFGNIMSGLAGGLIYGLVYGGLIMVVEILDYWSMPFPAAEVTNPSEIYRRDLQCAAVIISALCVGGGLVGGLVFGTHGELMGGLVGGFGLGLAIGLGSGFGPVIKLAWTERIWTLGGSTVRFIPLLQTALDRQVLRQAGAVYQFRHAALQDLLADSAQVDSLVADAKWGGS